MKVICDMNGCGEPATQIVAFNEGDAPGGGMIYLQFLCDKHERSTFYYQMAVRPISELTMGEDNSE